MTDAGDDTYHEDNFRILLEAYLPYFRSNPTNRQVNITVNQGLVWQGDFNGLLDSLKINKKYHFIITLLNSIKSSYRYAGDLDFIILPDFTEVDQINSVYSSLQRKF
jgi:hypothetical protein